MAKLSLPYRSARDLLCFKNAKQNKHLVKHIMDALFEWGQKDDALDIVSFCAWYGIPYSTLTGYITKWPDLEVVYQHIKLKIGVRRTSKKLTDDIHLFHLMKTHHMYHPEYAQAKKEQDELGLKKKNNEDTEKNFYFEGIKIDSVKKVDEEDIAE